MFTGIIQEIGVIERIRPTATGRDLTIHAPLLAATAQRGDSIAVNGICLTVTALEGSRFVCHAGAETLARSTARAWQPGRRVNLEPALRVGDRLGGHFVQGHVDCVGECLGRTPYGETIEFSFRLPEEYAVYLAEKGSVAVDGISLTVTRVVGSSFSVAIIPYTLAHTTLNEMQPGQEANIEVDILAKYVRRMLGHCPSPALTEDFLREHGFA